MPRNGSNGTFTVSTTFVANTLASAASVNSVLDDIGDELTNSVAADGQTTMTGPFKASDGTISAPGIAFGSDTNTGFYRSASGVIRSTNDGTNTLTVTATGATVTGTMAVSGAATFGNGGVVTPGTVQMFGGPVANIPTGYLFCNGAAVSRTTYADLFAAIATMHGVGDGSTTFNLPDYRNIFPIGANEDETSVAKTNVTGALTASGGSKDAINVSHTHTATVTDPGHGHPVRISSENGGSPDAAGGLMVNTASVANYDASTNATPSSVNGDQIGTNTTGVTVANSTEGSSGTNANLPPYAAVVFMIKT